ncbi:ATP-binding protein [Thermotoga sp. SG1]|uniref:ATP-binding protein n=1 Tax=Thermotoga sp. SG1 TaxID=126739 RepID=UPI000C775CAF|nr:DUF499 domain-containing protein [Thermotoga sp. SG1]PLV56044.1 AAA family ATPase [Thermotoga sp. SG1]
MKPFSQIATSHKDIVQGHLTMDVFAADLWQIVSGKAPLDYKDPDLFFKKTFLTKGLKNILDTAEKRLKGSTGDSVIQLQTPFGGGKTHTLIALYHKAKEWNANVVVIDGTALDPKEEKLWEEMERQLTGEVTLTRGNTSPGKEKLIELISKKSPVLILMDEVLEYMAKAMGVKVGDSNLATQSLAFIQELTGAVSAVGNALLVVTLPSSVLEHYDENTERMFQKLQRITGRTEKIYTPVSDEEIVCVVKKRLFERINEEEAKKIVDEFIEYAKSEGILSSEEEVLEYRKRFLESYPFKPEVIDVLYKRWGSFPFFQRTRGVLRLLSLVVHELLKENLPFIRICDFNLKNEDLRKELVKHLGSEWESVISQDITDSSSGAKTVDKELPASYSSYKLGTAVSTAIFMMCFTGRGSIEVSIKEIKKAVSVPGLPSSVIDTVINNLKEKLFFLSDEGLFFTNQPNLNRILVTREENIEENEIYEKELEILKKHVTNGSHGFKVYLHPKFPKDVPDNSDLKLVILASEKPSIDFLERCGESPRVYRNTLVFLCVDETQRGAFYGYLKKLIAAMSVQRSDLVRSLTEGQKRELGNKIKNYEEREYEELRKYYRKLFLPGKDGFEEMDMSYPMYGGESFLDKEIYEYLKEQGKILEDISPKFIKAKYLSENDYLETSRLYDAFLKTPGEIMLKSKDVLINGIKRGVEEGLFGFGYLEEEKPVCVKIDDRLEDVTFEENEIIVKPDICKKDAQTEKKEGEEGTGSSEENQTYGGIELGGSVTISESAETSTVSDEKKIRQLRLELKVPIGQTSTVTRILNYLKDRFSRVTVTVSIQAEDGGLEKSDYEDRILEALRQSGINIISEDKK